VDHRLATTEPGDRIAMCRDLVGRGGTLQR
jgi:hypothetical protein